MPETYPHATVIEVAVNWVKCRLDKPITHMGYEEEDKPRDMNDPKHYPQLRTDVILFDYVSSLEILEEKVDG